MTVYRHGPALMTWPMSRQVCTCLLMATCCVFAKCIPRLSDSALDLFSNNSTNTNERASYRHRRIIHDQGGSQLEYSSPAHAKSPGIELQTPVRLWRPILLGETFEGVVERVVPVLVLVHRVQQGD